ncbi:alpha-amylase family glycosyl hydrolase [Butyrivibrio sp. MB2005]|uniref:alpha-amylase family glycosyl hydrolase n=1 Tax=Butyrivibrio sp. MB2005 TaxID=1280678 RepID=UPI00040017DE|nr:alpha-amylase family glycosyl hydrolase [Butyrivibrio sp. MB2005]
MFRKNQFAAGAAAMALIIATATGCAGKSGPDNTDKSVATEADQAAPENQETTEADNQETTEADSQEIAEADNQEATKADSQETTEADSQETTETSEQAIDSRKASEPDRAAAISQMDEINSQHPLNVIDDKYRTTYEIFVYSFYDSDGDGIGDIQGVIDKLDYVNDGDDATDTDLGCNMIWLMPVCPSPTYHKYDVTDYCDIDPQYGTIDDYKKLLEEAHSRGIKVINDMVMNHTSSQHPWFKEAVAYLKDLPEGAEPDSAQCPYYDYYNFSKEEQTGYTRVSGTEWFYESRFWSEMPDLNLDNEAVQKEFADIAKFWLDLGCDGFRMDAVTSYTTDNTGKSTDELKVFCDAVYAENPDAYIVGEAWANSSEYSQYYGSGIDSLFDFDFSGSEGKIVKCAKGKMAPAKFFEELVKEDELYSGISETYVNAPFYTNHDMARSAGYYVGKGASDSIKLAGALNLMMNGNAFIYYGEEIGMKGSGKDENKRAPMQWTMDQTADGMCKGPSDMEKIEMTNGSLEDQEKDPYSIYNYYRNAVRLRNMFPEIARGQITILDKLSTDDFGVCMKEADDKILIALNNSNETVTEDLSLDERTDGFRTLSGLLLTGEETAALEGDNLTLPAHGIAIITVR